MLPKTSVASPISNMYLKGIPIANNRTYEIPSIIVINRNHPKAVENTCSSPYFFYKYKLIGTVHMKGFYLLATLIFQSISLSYYIASRSTNK